MKIYTRRGDDGTTGLAGGERVDKSTLRIEVGGQIDELNSVIGVTIGTIGQGEPFDDIRNILIGIQRQLFELGAEVANPASMQTQAESVFNLKVIEQLERMIDINDKELSPLKHFILPGGSAAASQLHLARAVCRRVERSCVKLGRQEKINSYLAAYLNRLSDVFFVLARRVNQMMGVHDVTWPGGSEGVSMA